MGALVGPLVRLMEGFVPPETKQDGAHAAKVLASTVADWTSCPGGLVEMVFNAIRFTARTFVVFERTKWLVNTTPSEEIARILFGEAVGKSSPLFVESGSKVERWLEIQMLTGASPEELPASLLAFTKTLASSDATANLAVDSKSLKTTRLLDGGLGAASAKINSLRKNLPL